MRVWGRKGKRKKEEAQLIVGRLEKGEGKMRLTDGEKRHSWRLQFSMGKRKRKKKKKQNAFPVALGGKKRGPWGNIEIAKGRGKGEKKACSKAEDGSKGFSSREDKKGEEEGCLLLVRREEERAQCSGRKKGRGSLYLPLGGSEGERKVAPPTKGG